jgi:hypothetical protein
MGVSKYPERRRAAVHDANSCGLRSIRCATLGAMPPARKTICAGSPCAASPSRRMAKTSSLQKARLDPCPFLESCFINRVERINECALCGNHRLVSPRHFQCWFFGCLFRRRSRSGRQQRQNLSRRRRPFRAHSVRLDRGGEERRSLAAGRRSPWRRAACADVLVVGGFCCWRRCCC